MPKLRYVGSSVPPITVPAAGAVSDDDGVIEVDDATAKSLLRQSVWEPAVQTRTTKKEND